MFGIRCPSLPPPDRASSSPGSSFAQPRPQGPEPVAQHLSPRGSGSQDARGVALAPRTHPPSGTVSPTPPPEAPGPYRGWDVSRSIGAALPVPAPGGGSPGIEQEVEQWRSQVAAAPVPPISYSLINYSDTTPPAPEECVARAARAVIQAADPTAWLLEINNLPATSLPPAIGRLAHLRILWIRDTECTALTDSICELAGLQHLSLDGNPRLTHLPDRIGELQQLTALTVTDTPLESWPEGIGALSRLARLRVSGGTYQQLPSCLAGLTALKQLSIGAHRHMQELPAKLRRLERLQRLDIESCPELKSLPPLRGLSALEVLELQQCPKLETLPSDLGDLSQLRTLVLSGCDRLTDLPESLSRLPQDCEIHVPPHLEERLAELRESRHVQPGCWW